MPWSKRARPRRAHPPPLDECRRRNIPGGHRHGTGQHLPADPRPREPGRPVPALRRAAPDRVTREADGSHVVSTYREIVALLHDPRVSSDPRSRTELAGAPRIPEEGPPGLPLDFIRRDPPEHDRLRELSTRPFRTPHPPGPVEGFRPSLADDANGLRD